MDQTVLDAIIDALPRAAIPDLSREWDSRFPRTRDRLPLSMEAVAQDAAATRPLRQSRGRGRHDPMARPTKA
jgi:hypothetical protein